MEARVYHGFPGDNGFRRLSFGQNGSTDDYSITSSPISYIEFGNSSFECLTPDFGLIAYRDDAASARPIRSRAALCIAASARLTGFARFAGGT